MEVTIKTGRGRRKVRKSQTLPPFVYKDCSRCNTTGCSGCNWKGTVGVYVPPNPPKHCRACNGTGCRACNYTGWMNGFAL